MSLASVARRSASLGAGAGRPASNVAAVALLANYRAPGACGLGIEYLIQITYRPVMTARRRSTAGGWSAHHIETSRSRGAASSTQLPEFFKAVQAQWDMLARATVPNTAKQLSTPAPGAVFPGSL
jgi:hypothetical protein